MSTLETRIADALRQHFMDIVAAAAGRPFEDTGVHTPGDNTWAGYARAAAAVATTPRAQAQPSDAVTADRDRLIHILVVHFDMFRAQAEEAADLFLHASTRYPNPKETTK